MRRYDMKCTYIDGQPRYSAYILTGHWYYADKEHITFGAEGGGDGGIQWWWAFFFSLFRLGITYIIYTYTDVWRVE